MLLGPLCAVLGRSWALCWRSGGGLGTYVGDLEMLLGLYGRSWVALGASIGDLGCTWAALGASSKTIENLQQTFQKSISSVFVFVCVCVCVCVRVFFLCVCLCVCFDQNCGR